MTTTEFEQRLEALEKKVADLSMKGTPSTNKDWVFKIWGSFANDPEFKKAMSYGRKWRKAENLKSLSGRKSSRARKRRK